jgi:3-deoxy-D-manno-octulosonate 8-phosphate phosphatase (KDO 8-P phosphatase)
MNVLALFKPIKLFAFDVDGVLTDGSLLLFENGEMARRMNIKDGYALQLAIKKGYEIIIISGAESIAVKKRLEKLGIKHIFQGVNNKLGLLTTFIAENKYVKEQVLFMGDDMPDLPCMQNVSLACAPVDAAIEIKNAAQYISPINSGMGCVRDVIEKVLKLNNHWTNEDQIAAI